MQAENDLLSKLLKQLPVKVLRDNFKASGHSQDELITAIKAGYTSDALTTFYCEHFSYTKQHVYIYRLNRPYAGRWFDTSHFPYDIINRRNFTGGTDFYCFPLVTFSATTLNPLSRVTIQFYQPIYVHMEGSVLRIHFTMLEKNLKSYFGGSHVVGASRDLDEEYFRSQILGGLTGFNTNRCDLNKGVKHLWQTGVIDGKSVRFFKADSTSAEEMNQDKLFKDVYPEIFKELMKGPVSKTVMKYVKNDGYFCDIFTVDPTEGQVNFSNYPNDARQINNVLTTIFQHN